MGDFFNQIDIFALLITIAYFLFGVLASILSVKYKKMSLVLKECKELVNFASEAWKDKKITEDEAKVLLAKLTDILNVIKK